jgi:hypothetical protein
VFDITLYLLWPVVSVVAGHTRLYHVLDVVLTETTSLLSEVFVTNDWLAVGEQSPRNALAVLVEVNGLPGRLAVNGGWEVFTEGLPARSRIRLSRCRRLVRSSWMWLMRRSAPGERAKN